MKNKWIMVVGLVGVVWWMKRRQAEQAAAVRVDYYDPTNAYAWSVHPDITGGIRV